MRVLRTARAVRANSTAGRPVQWRQFQSCARLPKQGRELRSSTCGQSVQKRSKPLLAHPAAVGLAEVDAGLTKRGSLPRAVEVFTPNDTPTFTYVERTSRFEERLNEALSIPKMIVSLSGPSKSGKTVLVNKVVKTDNLIPLSGATIRTASEL